MPGFLAERANRARSHGAHHGHRTRDYGHRTGDDCPSGYGSGKVTGI
jgi:hypothetical protein